MLNQAKDIISQLRQDILFLQGSKKATDQAIEVELPEINQVFPQKTFPLSCIHEFVADKIENVSATIGFIGHIISQLMKSNNTCIWVGHSPTIFPSALKTFGVEADKMVFIYVRDFKERLWVIEEALKCEGVSAVVGELKELGFTESRRFQLAVEKSNVTGFIIRYNPAQLNINACVSRWRISTLLSKSFNSLPGIGFPRWNIELLKIRNGKPGTWQMEYCYGKPHLIESFETNHKAENRKVVGYG